MKKNVLLLFLSLFLISNVSVMAKPPSKKPPIHRTHHHHSSSSSYLVRTDYYTDEHKFVDCDEHKMTSETVVSYYSDGRRYSHTRYTLKNKDGSIIEDNCTNASHLVYNKNHYFIFRKNKKYNLMRADGEIISSRKYTSMQEIAPNRLLVRADKKYGIIDLDENLISPLKYKEIEFAGKDLYITKLNGYYGMMNSSNNILIKNEYDSIKPLYDTYILKMFGKYGLADINGSVLLKPEYDKIKNLGEYILVKKDKYYQIYDSSGKLISEKYYKKVRLNRNTLEGKLKTDVWVKIK